MTYGPGLSLVCVNYRTSWDLARFLRSLEAHPPTVPWSIAIVNVDPKPDDKEVAEDWAADYENATVVSFDSNVGFSRAVNRGAQLGQHEVIAIFNADVRITARSLDECHEALLSDPLWGILGPRQVNDEGRLVAAGIFGPKSKPAHRGWLEHDRGQYRDVRDDATITAGSAFFIRRDVWDTLRNCPIFTKISPQAEGAFILVPLYFEDSAASVHADAHGFRNVFWGPVTMVHRLSQAVKHNDMKTQARIWFGESRITFNAFCDAHSIEREP